MVIWGQRSLIECFFVFFLLFSLLDLKRSLYCKEDESNVGSSPVSPGGFQSREPGTSVGMKRHGLKLASIPSSCCRREA